MKKSFKKVLSVVLCVVMLLSVTSMVSFAADGEFHALRSFHDHIVAHGNGKAAGIEIITFMSAQKANADYFSQG